MPVGLINAWIAWHQWRSPQLQVTYATLLVGSLLQVTSRLWPFGYTNDSYRFADGKHRVYSFEELFTFSKLFDLLFTISQFTIEESVPQIHLQLGGFPCNLACTGRWRRSVRPQPWRYVDYVLELRHKRTHHSKVHYLQLLSGPLHWELQREIHSHTLNIHPAARRTISRGSAGLGTDSAP